MSQSLATSQHFAYVDRRAILEASPGGVAVQAILQRETAVWQAQLKRMSDSLNTMIAAFQKSSGTMPLALKDQRARELQLRQNALQITNDSLGSVAERRRNELLQPVIDQINLAVEDVRVDRGLDLIFDSEGGVAIAAANKNLDLDDRVLAKLRLMPLPVLPAAHSDAPKAPSKPSMPSGLPINSPVGVGHPTSPVTPIKPDSTVPRKPESTVTAEQAGSHATE